MNPEDRPTPETDKVLKMYNDCADPSMVHALVDALLYVGRNHERQRDTALSDLHSLRQQADAMAGALEAKWMPISTAPKNGDEILLGWSYLKLVGYGSWDETSNDWLALDSECHYYTKSPDFWQPLPPAPPPTANPHEHT